MPKKIALAVFFIVTLILTYGIIGQIVNTLRSGDRLVEATNELNQLQLKNQQLKEKFNQVNTDYFVEKQARDELNLSRDGEVTIVIPDEKINQVLGKDKKNDEVKLPNWQGWLRLFFK